MEHLSFTQPEADEIDCFVCEAGCVHFEYGYLLLNFSREQFFKVAEMFDEVRQEILKEDGLKDWDEDILIEKTI